MLLYLFGEHELWDLSFHIIMLFTLEAFNFFAWRQVEIKL